MVVARNPRGVPVGGQLQPKKPVTSCSLAERGFGGHFSSSNFIFRGKQVAGRLQLPSVKSKNLSPRQFPRHLAHDITKRITRVFFYKPTITMAFIRQYKESDFDAMSHIVSCIPK